MCSKLAIKRVESRVFIVNSEDISHLFFSVCTVECEQVNVFQGALSCVNIFTQSLQMSKCCI